MTARKYSEATSIQICAMIAEGESLESIAKLPGFPSRRSVRDWLAQVPDFERRYELARRERADNLVDEMVEIADSVRGSDDNAAVAAARLAVDTRRWIAAKMLPTRFGERVELTGSGGSDLIPAPSDPSKIALILLSILNRSRPAEIEAEAAVPELEPGVVRRIGPPPEPAHAALGTGDTLGSGPVGPQWTFDETGQVRHISELTGSAGPGGSPHAASPALRVVGKNYDRA